MAKSPARRSSRSIDKQVQKTYSDLQNRFEFVAKARANIWVTAAAVLFVIGFIVGAAYLADPQAFLAGSLESTQSDAAFLVNTLTPTQTNIGTVPTTITPGGVVTPVNGGSTPPVDPSTCVRRAPLVQLVSPTTTVTIPNGSTQNYTVRVTNKDSSACNNVNFLISHGPQDGTASKWNFFVLSNEFPVGIILAPNASGNFIVRVSPWDVVPKTNIPYGFNIKHSFTTSSRWTDISCDYTASVSTRINVTEGNRRVGTRATNAFAPGCNTNIQDTVGATSNDSSTESPTNVDDGGTTIINQGTTSNPPTTTTTGTPTKPTGTNEAPVPIKNTNTNFWQNLLSKYLSGGFVPSTK